MTDAAHIPVLTRELIQLLAPATETVVVDCTLGLGGHAAALLEGVGPAVRLLGLDVSPGNLAAARANLARFGERVQRVNANFSQLARIVDERGIPAVDAVYADLGVSSNQIADPAVGLSFEVDGPLDMRLDPRLLTTAADLVNGLTEEELASLLYLQGEEHGSRRIAKALCQARRRARINSTVLLARLVADALGQGGASRRGRIHPATRTFLALRSAVNGEQRALSALLEQIPAVLRPGGRAAIISFHSLEDRLVKESFRRWERAGVYRLLTKKPIVPDSAETTANPRSRSAKLRVAELVRRRLPQDENGG